jgi:O-antigen/teichoic acid export membrane protein
MGRIGRHGLVYTAGILLSKGMAMVMLPIYTRYLTPADYGILQLMQMVLEAASIVAGSRLGAGVFYYYHKAETPAQRQTVLSTAFLLLLTTYAAVALGTYLAAPAIAGFVFGTRGQVALVRIAGTTLACDSLFIVPLAFLRVRDRSRLYVGVGAAKLLLQLALNLLFVVYFRMGAKGVLLSSLAGSWLVGAGLAAWFVRTVGWSFSRSAVRGLLRFGVPFMGTQGATFLLTFGDRYFLRAASDVSVVGLYGLAYQFGFLLAMVGEVPFNTVWEPMRFELAQRQDRDGLYARAFVYFNVVLLTVAVGISLFVGDFLRIFADPAYGRAADLVPIILIAYILQSWTVFHNIGLLMRERTEFYTLANWIGALVALAGYAVLIPRWLGLGAAVATLVAFASREWTVYAMSQRLWPVRYQWGPVLRLVLTATSVGALGLFVSRATIWTSLIAHVLLLLVYFAGVWSLGVLSHGDRAMIRRAIRSPRMAWSTVTTS